MPDKSKEQDKKDQIEEVVITNFDQIPKRGKWEEKFLIDGKFYVFRGKVIDVETQREIEAEFLENVKELYADKDAPHYKDRTGKSTKAFKTEEKHIELIRLFRYYEAGFAKPNKIQVPGKDIDEKIKSVQTFHPGYFMEIANKCVMSANVTNLDADFFFKGLFQPK